MNAKLFSQFLDLVYVTDGKADSIVKAIMEVLDKKQERIQQVPRC